MSDIARNKAAVMAFVDIVNSKGFGEAVASIPEDCSWWIGGVTRSKAEMAQVVGWAGSVLKEWGTYEVTAITAEEDRVALETISHAELKNGAHYSNAYHFLFRLRDGRFTEIREHCDTKYAADIMGGRA